MTEVSEFFEHWCIVEMFGHIRVGARVTEEEHFGVKMARLDIPNDSCGFTTQLIGGAAIFRLTPTTEEIARAVAARSQPEPVHRWELPAANQGEMAYSEPDPNEDRDLEGEDY